MTINYTTSNNPSLTWGNNCGDNGSSNNIPLSGPNYSFGFMDIHCTTINSSISYTSATCPSNQGTISWKVSNIGTYGANIVNFKVYKSTGDPATDSDPAIVSYVSGTTVYSVNFPNIASNTYNIKLQAFIASGDNNNPSIFTTLFCGGDVAPPGGLVANVNCISTSDFRVDFSWQPAAPGTYDYIIETATGGSAPTDHESNAWAISGPDFSPMPVSSTYVSKNALSTGFAFNTTYWWHVKAANNPVVPGLPPYYSVVDQFVTPSSCATSWPSPQPTGEVITCASTTDNLNNNTEDDNFVNANPNYYKFLWNASSANPADILAERLEVSSDSAFLPSTTTVVTSGFTSSGISRLKIVNVSLTSKSYWRVGNKMANNQWYWSKAKDIFVPFQCIYGSSPLLQVSAYCDGWMPMFNLRWTAQGNSTWNIVTRISGAVPADNFVAITSTNSFVWNGKNEPKYSIGSTFDFYVSSPSFGNSNVVTISKAVGCTTLNAPTNLDAVIGCETNKDVVVTFHYTDTNYPDPPGTSVEYWLEVSSEPFTGLSSTNPSSKWGLRKLLPGPGGSWDWRWTAIYQDGSKGPLTSGVANPQTVDTSDDFMPVDGVSYYYRMKAISINGTTGVINAESPYVYPDGSVLGTQYPTGIATPRQSCKPRYDMSASFIPNSWKNSSGAVSQSFTGSENVSVDIRIENKASALSSTSYPTNVYFYYKGSVGTGNDQVPNCTALSKGSPPTDGAAATKGFAVPAIPQGGFVVITVPFNVGATSGSFTAQAYVVPACNFNPDPQVGIDPDWTNNQTPTGFTYAVGFGSFFETQGGDVGLMLDEPFL